MGIQPVTSPVQAGEGSPSQANRLPGAAIILGGIEERRQAVSSSATPPEAPLPVRLPPAKAGSQGE
jgi:hypothetical protein